MTAAFVRDLDATILRGLDPVGMTDSAMISGRPVPGYYIDQFVESDNGEQAVVGTYHAFDCREEDLAGLELGPDLPIDVTGWGQFRFLRAESGNAGRVVIVLGKWL